MRRTHKRTSYYNTQHLAFQARSADSSSKFATIFLFSEHSFDLFVKYTDLGNEKNKSPAQTFCVRAGDSLFILLVAALIAAAHAFVARAGMAVAVRAYLDAFEFAHLLVRLVVAAGAYGATDRLILRHDFSLLFDGILIACPAFHPLCGQFIVFTGFFQGNTAAARATTANRAPHHGPRSHTTHRCPYSRRVPSCDSWTAAFHLPTRPDRRR